MHKIHFISGLPRSGSTLLAAGGEFYSFFDLEKRKTIFSTYYEEHSGKDIIFDTSRVWTAHLHQLSELYDDFKVICCVRNPAWIMDSFESIYRKNRFDYSRMFSPQGRQTVYTRCESLVNAAGSLGSAWTALKEAYYGEYSDKLLLINYDLLTQYPQKSMGLLNQFIGQEAYVHNFDNVEYEEGQFDEKLGVKGLH